MKFNKWTLGLAAVGAVSMASAVRADDAPKPSPLNTALSNTTISGYVSSSANWTMDPSGNQSAKSYYGNSPAANIPLQSGKQNGFNLDVVKLSLSKPEDATPYASGYQVDLLFGPDAVGWNPSANSVKTQSTENGGENYQNGGTQDFAIQQAYISLNTPVGNGIDWKFGVFNTVIGYESFDAGSNPNYTRSWGWAVEPTEHTGVLASYKVNDEFSFNAGIANTLTAGINTRNNYNVNSNGGQWNKTFMGSVTFNAPSNWGWASGSAFYAGMVYGWAGGTQGQSVNANGTNVEGTQGGNQVNYYAGATLNSPWKDVTFGAAFDYVQNVGGTSYETPSGSYIRVNDYIGGLYNTIKATEKLSFNSRFEYWYVQGNQNNSNGAFDNGVSLTETVEYDLWANVVSRLELRYDKCTRAIGGVSGGYMVLPNGAQITDATSYGLYANLVYKF